MSDTDGVPCPNCGTGLPLSASFCWKCKEYVSDMGDPEQAITDEEFTAIHGIPDDRLEDVIQEAGRKALELLGFTVYSLSQDRATRQTPGIADTYVAGHGRTTWAEWKRPGENQSPDQLAFEADVTANGADYHVWRHELEAAKWAQRVIEAEKVERAKLDRNDPLELAGR